MKAYQAKVEEQEQTHKTLEDAAQEASSPVTENGIGTPPEGSAGQSGEATVMKAQNEQPAASASASASASAVDSTVENPATATDAALQDRAVIDAELAKGLAKFGDSLWYNEKAPATHSSNCCLWTSVLLLYAGNVLFRFVALALVPLSTIAPTSALTIACNILLAKYYFREKMSKSGFVGTFLVVVGCCMAIIVGQKKEESLPLQELLALFQAGLFIWFITIYSAIFVISLVYTMYIKGTLIRMAIWIAARFPCLDRILLTDEEVQAAEAKRRLTLSQITTGAPDSPSSKSISEHDDDSERGSMKSKPGKKQKTNASISEKSSILSDDDELEEDIEGSESQIQAEDALAGSAPVAGSTPKTLLDILPVHYSLPIVAKGFSLVPYNPNAPPAPTSMTTAAANIEPTTPLPVDDGQAVPGDISTQQPVQGSPSLGPTRLRAPETSVAPVAPAAPVVSTSFPPSAAQLSVPLMTEAIGQPLEAVPESAAGVGHSGSASNTPNSSFHANRGAPGIDVGATTTTTAPLPQVSQPQQPQQSAGSGLVSTFFALPSYMSNVVGGIVEGMARTAVQFDVLGQLEISRSRAMSRAEGPSSEAIHVPARAGVASSSPFVGARRVHLAESADDASAAAAEAKAKRKLRIRRRGRHHAPESAASLYEGQSSFAMSTISTDKMSVGGSSAKGTRSRHESIGEESDTTSTVSEVIAPSVGFALTDSGYSRTGTYERAERHVALISQLEEEVKQNPSSALFPTAPSVCATKEPAPAAPTRTLDSVADRAHQPVAGTLTEYNKFESTALTVEEPQEDELLEDDEEDEDLDEDTEAALDEQTELDIYAADEIRERIATKRMRSLTDSQRRLFALALAYMGSYTAAWMNLTGKAAMAMLRATFSGDNQFSRWEAYFILIGLVVSVVSSLKLMSFMMSHFPALYIVPIYQCLFIIGLILVGVFFFDEFSTLHTTEMVLFIVAILICFIGIYLITNSHMSSAAVSTPASSDQQGEDDANADTARDSSNTSIALHDQRKLIDLVEGSKEADSDMSPKASTATTLPINITHAPQQVVIHLDG